MVAVVRRAHEEDRPTTRLVPPLALAAFVNMTGALALGPFLPVIADELGSGVAVLGQVPALAMLLAAAAFVWWSRPRGVAVPDAVPA